MKAISMLSGLAARLHRFCCKEGDAMVRSGVKQVNI